MNRCFSLRPGVGFVIALMTASSGAWALTLVENGQPKAVLVVPDEQKFVSTYAAMEFQYNVKKASGAELAIVPETEAEKMPGEKVYFGQTKALEKAGLGKEDLGKYGYAGRLKDGSLYFYGRDTEGSRSILSDRHCSIATGLLSWPIWRMAGS